MKAQYIRRTSDRMPNGFAVWALICGAGQFLLLPLWARLIPAQLAAAVMALAFGLAGNRQAKATGQPGRGIAKAAIVLGAAGVGLSGIMILLVIAIIESLAGL
jgi:hypothetical protein